MNQDIQSPTFFFTWNEIENDRIYWNKEFFAIVQFVIIWRFDCKIEYFVQAFFAFARIFSTAYS